MVSRDRRMSAESANVVRGVAHGPSWRPLGAALRPSQPSSRLYWVVAQAVEGLRARLGGKTDRLERVGLRRRMLKMKLSRET